MPIRSLIIGLEFQTAISGGFELQSNPGSARGHQLETDLYERIGQFKMEMERLKKSSMTITNYRLISITR